MVDSGLAWAELDPDPGRDESGKRPLVLEAGTTLIVDR